jgi:hypothetical protein
MKCNASISNCSARKSFRKLGNIRLHSESNKIKASKYVSLLVWISLDDEQGCFDMVSCDHLVQ